jgi:hypothetical protein
MDHSSSNQREAWSLNPTLDMPELSPPAVMFSIHDSDPLVKFKAALVRLSDAMVHQKLGDLPHVTPSMMKQLTLRSAWDSVFHDVPGDRMGLLSQNPGLSPSGNQGEAIVHAVVIMSTEHGGKKWVVTRATEFHGKSVCWCVPVDVEKGMRSEVVLTSANMTTLESV